MTRKARKPWRLVHPEEITLDGITHRACRWDDNQKLTDCGIHYMGRSSGASGVDCLACLADRPRDAADV